MTLASLLSSGQSKIPNVTLVSYQNGKFQLLECYRHRLAVGPASSLFFLGT